VPISQARASSCIAVGLSDRANAVCVGHLLYGLTPFDDLADIPGVRPVLRAIRSRLIHVGRHPQGSDVAVAGGYGLIRGRVTGVLPVGRSSGLGELDPARPVHALIGGQCAPLIGISLEHTTVDLDGLADAKVGDAVELVNETAPGGTRLGDALRALAPALRRSRQGRLERLQSDSVTPAG